MKFLSIEDARYFYWLRRLGINKGMAIWKMMRSSAYNYSRGGLI